MVDIDKLLNKIKEIGIDKFHNTKILIGTDGGITLKYVVILN